MRTPLVPVSPWAGREGRNWGSSLPALPDLEQVVWELPELLWDILVSTDLARSHSTLRTFSLVCYACPNSPVCKTE